MKDERRDQLVQCCKQLRIGASLADRALSCDDAGKIQFLLTLLSDEIAFRKEKRINQMITQAHFPRIESFEYFESSEVELPKGLTVTDLQDLKFIQERRNLIMYGATGTGKTMLSICIGLAACRRGIPVQFFRTAALVNKLSEAREKKKLDAFLAKLNEATILIIDEFGYVPYDRAGTQILFEYLSERHEDPGKVIIITTNLEFSAWANVVYDADMASALIGRLVHRCHLLLFPGGNYRLRESSINELYQSMTVRSGKEAG